MRVAGRCMMTALLLLAPLPAAAWSLTDPVPADAMRELCSEEPGDGSPACIVDAGHVEFDFTPVDAFLRRRSSGDTDIIAYGTLLARIGLNSTLEADIAWTPWEHFRDRSGGVQTVEGVTGPVYLAVKQSLRHPDGGGVSVAILPSLVVPTDGRRVEGQIALPLSYELGDVWQLALTPAVDISPNAERQGYNIGGRAVVALSATLGAVTVGGELSGSIDSDPDASLERASANLTLSWTPPRQEALLFYAGSNFGLTADTDDVRLYFGAVRRF